MVADVNELTSLSPVYYESDSRPSAQNIMMFPGGISGKQLYIYKNTSGPSQNNNSILDICEIEKWGIYNAIVTAYSDIIYVRSRYGAYIMLSLRHIIYACFCEEIRIYGCISSCISSCISFMDVYRDINKGWSRDQIS